MESEIFKLGFSLDTRPLEKGERKLDAFSKSGDGAEKSTGKFSKSAAGMATTLGIAVGAITAVTGALAAYAYNIGISRRELEASARLAGDTVERFQAQEFTYRQFGLTVDNVTDIFKDARERIGEFVKGMSGGLDDFGTVMGWTKERTRQFAMELTGLSGQDALQVIVNQMESAGASANEMSWALEGLGSEATRMIPALTDNGAAIRNLTSEYASFNDVFRLDEKEIDNYSRLTKNFDLFLATAENGMTKVIAPLAGHMADLAMATSHFLSSLQEGTEANIASQLVDINAQIREYNQAIEDNATATGRAKNALLGFTDGTSTDNDFMRDQIELLKQRRTLLMERLAQQRTGTSGLIDSSEPVEMIISESGRLRDVVVSDIGKMSEAQKAWDKMLKDGTLGMTEYVDTSTETAKRAKKAWEEMLKEGTLGATSFVKTSSSVSDQLSEMMNGTDNYLRSIQQLSTNGSDAYKKLERAILAVNIAQAAVSGNIFGAVASGIGLLMTFDKELKDVSMEIQANQNLDAWGEKADSISQSVDITASATEKLVGINTKMLNALRAVQNGIIGASGLIARDKGSAQVDVGGLGIISNVLTDTAIGSLITKALDFNIIDTLSLGLFSGLGKAIGGLLGGKSNVTDQGIQIIGGLITDMTNDVLVQAYQNVSYKKHRFSSTKHKTAIETLSGDVRDQFSLVFGSIIESVATGASALGINQSEIDRAINNFSIGTAKISLKGLSREQQQKEIEAYFSRVFNDLSTATIPFLTEFQRAGEELGETLSRVATQVSIMEFAADNLGITISSKISNPKAFAVAADNITMLVGGLESFAEKTSSFVSMFANDADKISIYEDSLTKSLREVGLSLPSTSDAMWNLMSTLNATTEAGQEQIATLLNVAGEADAYYKLLDREAEQRTKMADTFRNAAMGIFDVTEATRQIGLESALTAARLGDLSLAEKLDLSNINPKSSDFASLFDFQLAQADTSNKLLELAAITDGQLTVEDKQLAELEKIRQAVSGESLNTNSEERTAMNELKEEVQNLSRNMGRMQSETNENLDRIANGVTTVRVEA